MRHGGSLITALAIGLLAGCKGDMSLQPRSSGRPYEVVACGTDGAASLAMAGILRAIPAEGLPQQETAFDVSEAGGGMGQTVKYARAIVMADIDGGRYADTRIRYEKDVYAKPQMVVYVCTPSLERLRTDSMRIQRAVGGLLGRFELNAAINSLRTERNNAAEQAADSIVGHTVWIAKDLRAMKRGRDFVWLSDNSATAMRNICVYSYSGTELSPERAVAMRDSVMRANIPGDTPQMYMVTAASRAPQTVMRSERGQTVMETRGLWEMRGDAMGGPFVSHSVVDSLRRRVIVAEAFVFAPGEKKRNIMRQLEAALYTLK